MTFDGANKYCEESIEKLQQLANYVKERKKIEEEYAHSLRKLCKLVSLKPFKKDDWFEESDKTNVYKTTLWRTFYEIIDDTAQISKAHDAFADSLKNRILEPLTAAIKAQKDERKKLQESAQEFLRNVNDAKIEVKKSFQKYEEAFEKHSEFQSTAERYNATGRIKDYDKVLNKVRAAKQKLQDATDRHEDAKALLERIKSDIEKYESPKLLEKVRDTEAARMRGALTHIVELIESERRRTRMNETYVEGMAAKLKQIDLQMDDQHFNKVHIQENYLVPPSLSSSPNPLRIANVMSFAKIAMPSSPMTVGALEKEDNVDVAPPRYTTYEPIIEDFQIHYPELPRVPSMPPAYSNHELSCSTTHLSSSLAHLNAYSTGNTNYTCSP